MLLKYPPSKTKNQNQPNGNETERSQNFVSLNVNRILQEEIKN